MKDINLEWMKSGKIGCTFATFFARNPDKIGWIRIFNPERLIIPDRALILSLVFERNEGWNKELVREWALDNGFYEEAIDNEHIGLRYKTVHGVSWVQYFGFDNHVKTRQTPDCELCFTVKLPVKSYFKVGIDTILHLAHASVEGLSEELRDIFWDSSFVNTCKRLGHKPTVKEAAKTTWEKKVKY